MTIWPWSAIQYWRERARYVEAELALTKSDLRAVRAQKNVTVKVGADNQASQQLKALSELLGRMGPMRKAGQ